MRERCGEPIPSEITNRKIGWQEVMSGRWHGSDLLERWLNMVTLLLCTAKVDLIKSTHGHRSMTKLEHVTDDVISVAAIL